ncbi:MAG: MATE family efflux transporter [Lachnospiraceae bacterium]|nr:MATE family efflux transporter [Lachnospiraceae bacterium]
MEDITKVQTKEQQIRLATRIAIPVLLENLLMTLVSIVDTAMVGSIGAYATTAVALITSPGWLVNATVQGFNAGCSVLVAHRVGAGDWEGARRGARESMKIGLFLGLFFFSVFELLSVKIPVWMGGAEDICPISTTYIRIIALGYPLYIMGLATCGAIRGAGDTSTPMKITALANLLNIIFNFLLIYPSREIVLGPVRFMMWGAGWGVTGAAVATGFSTAVSGVTALVIMLRRKNGLYIRLAESFRLIRSDMREILEVALPTAGERLTINFGQVMYIRIISSLGSVMLAAHHIAITAEAISYNPGYGYQAAGTTLTGQSIGAKNEKLAHSYGAIIIWSGVAVMFVTGALLVILARPFVSLFTPDPDVTEYAAMAERIAGVAQPFFALSIVGSGVLRGLGDAKITIPIAMLCMWAIRLPLALLFVLVFHLGLRGAWYALLIDLVLRGIVTLWRFYSGRWKTFHSWITEE